MQSLYHDESACVAKHTEEHGRHQHRGDTRLKGDDLLIGYSSSHKCAYGEGRQHHDEDSKDKAYDCSYDGETSVELRYARFSILQHIARPRVGRLYLYDDAQKINDEDDPHDDLCPLRGERPSSLALKENLFGV